MTGDGKTGGTGLIKLVGAVDGEPGCERHTGPAPRVGSAIARSHYDYRAGRIPSNRRGVRDGTKPLPGLGKLQDSSNPSGQAGFPPSLSPSRVSPAARRRPRRLPMAAYSADRHGASGKAEAREHSMSQNAAREDAGGDGWRGVWDVRAERAGRA